MEDKDQVETYIKLYQQQMEHYHHTQDVEWKGNFGIWTLLAAAIYLFVQRLTTTPSCLALIVCVLITVTHCCWLHKIHESEEFDKQLWARYRGEARRLLLNGDDPPSDEDFKARSAPQRLVWLLLEAGLTAALSGALFTAVTGQMGR